MDEQEALNGEELNLEDRLIQDILIRSAVKTANKELVKNRKQRRRMTRAYNPGIEYGEQLRTSLKDTMASNFLSFLTKEEACAAIVAATKSVMSKRSGGDFDACYEEEIPRVVLNQEYESFLEIGRELAVYGRYARRKARETVQTTVKMLDAAEPLKKLRRKKIEAEIDALHTLGYVKYARQ